MSLASRSNGQTFTTVVVEYGARHFMPIYHAGISATVRMRPLKSLSTKARTTSVCPRELQQEQRNLVTMIKIRDSRWIGSHIGIDRQGECSMQMSWDLLTSSQYAGRQRRMAFWRRRTDFYVFDRTKMSGRQLRT